MSISPRIPATAFIITTMIFAGFTDLRAQSALDWTESDVKRFERMPVVSVATDATWPPMEFINRDRELVGFDIDLLREVGLRAGFRPVFQTVPWDGIFVGLAARHYDMIASSVTVLEERKNSMLFSEPYLQAAQFLVVRRDDNRIARLEDLAGEEVGAQIGTTGSRIARDAGAAVRTYDDLGLAIEDLVQGRLRGVVADVAIVDYYILGHRDYGSRLSVVDTPYAVEDYAFAIRRDLLSLREDIDHALVTIREDGTLDNLKRFWFRNIVPGER
jgi:polar amino acid transport system substrate-binding protein